MKVILRFTVLITLLAIAPISFAELPDYPVGGITEEDLDGSYAIQMYRAIFGGVAYYSVLSLPPEGIDSALASMSMVFNLSVFVVLSYLLFMVMMGKLVTSGNDGQMMSKRYNDTMAVTRATMSMCGLLPVVSGFCLAQVFVMFIAVQASFIADEVNKAANKWTYTNGSIATYRPDVIKINNLIHSMITSEACASAMNNYYYEHPSYQARYEIKFADTSSSMPTDADTAKFRFSYHNAKNEEVCGSIHMQVGADQYFGAVGDPTGTFSIGGDMTDHQRAIRDKVVTAHKTAIAKTHNFIASGISAGIVIPGEDVDNETFKSQVKQARDFYTQSLLNAFISGTDALNDAWDQQVDATFQENALTFSAARGWVYNGFTWIDKSRAESFMSKLSREAPIATDPDEINSFENAFIRERWTRTRDILKKLRNQIYAPGAENYGEEVITSTSELEALQYDALAEGIFKSANWEAVTATVFTQGLQLLLIESQFNFKDYDPITNLQHFGYRMVNTGWSMIGVGVGVDVAASSLAAAADHNLLVKAGEYVTGGVVSAGKATGLKLAEYFVSAMFSLGGLLVAIGSILAYWLPALPFFMWDLAVLGNYLLVLVAFMAAPLWMAAHAMPEGDGFSGDHARQGWLVMITILARPSIMVMTWHVALLLMREMGNFTSIFLNYIPLANSEAIVGFWGSLVGLIIYLMFETIIAYRCTSLIYEVPDQIPIYYGGQTSTANESIGEGKGQTMIAGWSSHTQNAANGMMAGGGAGAGAGAGAGKQPNNKDF